MRALTRARAPATGTITVDGFDVAYSMRLTNCIVR
jgi:hypothetical protein